jgi:NaMN:DMB phosphoribosyltransferase
MATVGNDALRLPAPVMEEAKQWAEKDATPLEQFVTQAVLEKIAALKAQAYFAARRARADLPAFDRVLAKAGGEPPRSDDALPQDW